MWKSVVGHNVSVKVAGESDDWETDPDFENDVSEQEQRWGSKTIEGSGRKEHISVADLRQKVSHEHDEIKKKQMEEAPKASYGYGGKYGVEKDRMDKGAVGHGYVAKVEQHSSQKDAAKGFGGKYGVQEDRVDKSALSYKYKGEVEKHASQKDYAKGFGGKYGVQKERVDKAAVGYEYKGETEKHQSQKDYSKGFGGKYGVEKEKVDKAALGYDYKGETEKHQSQKDYSKGFGGKYGVEKEKVDKAALGYDYKGETEKHQSQKDYSKGFGGKYGVEKEKVDKAALGYDYKGETEKHQSQKDYAKGFGGQYGVEADRMDKSASSFNEMESPTTSYKKTQPSEASTAGAGNLKARFENMAKASEEENRRRAEEERVRRQVREQREREESSQEAEQRSVPAPVAPPASQEFRPLPETPRDMPDHADEMEEQPDYDEPPSLPARSAELLEEEQPDEDAPPPLPPREEDVGVYEDIANLNDADNDYEDVDCGISAVALYDYQGEADDEISFMPDDIITNIEMVDEGWWKGSCHGRIGLFPASFVKLS